MAVSAHLAVNDPGEPGGASSAAFDNYADDYEQALNKGLVLSGESPDYFAAMRVDLTARWLQALGVSPLQRVADFGCGVGNSTPHFRRCFPEARLLGLDASARSLRRARELHRDAARFAMVSGFETTRDHDLVYCNGVFHHIAPGDREKWGTWVRNLLAPGGYFALWENNPWNPGTRMVMRRIPFDRDAIPITPPEARLLLSAVGFEIVGTRYRFYFPRALSALRPLERFGERLPLGAQYCVLARKPGVPQPRGFHS